MATDSQDGHVFSEQAKERKSRKGSKKKSYAFTTREYEIKEQIMSIYTQAMIIKGVVWILFGVPAIWAIYQKIKEL